MLQNIQVTPGKKIEEQTFVGANVQIDGGCAYIRCRFVNCTLAYAGVGPVQMERSTLENCRYQFVGPAGNAFNFLKALYANGSKEIVEQLFQDIRSGTGFQAATNQEKPVTLQ